MRGLKNGMLAAATLLAVSLGGQPAQARTWSGCLGSVSIGYLNQSTKTAGVIGFDAKDVTYDLGLGCDVQAKAVVSGLMPDIDWTNAHSMASSVDYNLFAGARLGVPITPNLMPYALAGHHMACDQLVRCQL